MNSKLSHNIVIYHWKFIAWQQLKFELALCDLYLYSSGGQCQSKGAKYTQHFFNFISSEISFLQKPPTFKVCRVVLNPSLQGLITWLLLSFQMSSTFALEFYFRFYFSRKRDTHQSTLSFASQPLQFNRSSR